MSLPVAYKIGDSPNFGNVVARQYFTPQQQAVMDNGGNYAGYAVVDGHYTYVGAGRTGEAARAAVFMAAPVDSTKGDWMSGPAGMTGATSGEASPIALDPSADPYGDYFKQLADRDATDRAAATGRQRADAFASLSNLLKEYGLESLSPWVQQMVQQDKSAAEIGLALRETPEFKAEFPEIAERQKRGLTPISAGEIVAYRRSATQLFRAAGLPEGFHDSKDDYTKFIAGDVSLAELADRINLAANAAFKMPAEDRQALAEWGMGPGDLTAFWLNPDVAQPLLERKYAAAQLAGASKRSGFGSLSESEATGLQQAGVTQDQAQAGFGALVASQELFNPLDAGEDTITRDEQIGGVLGGNARAQQRITQRAARRRAAFDEGGGFASNQRGLVGLGRADQ